MFLPSSSTHLETDSHFFKQFITLPPTFLQGLIIEVICHTAQHFVGYGLNLNVSQACNKIIIIMEICKVPTPQLKALNKHNALCIYWDGQCYPHFNKSYHIMYTSTRVQAKLGKMHTHTHTHAHIAQTDSGEGQCCLIENEIEKI